MLAPQLNLFEASFSRSFQPHATQHSSKQRVSLISRQTVNSSRHNLWRSESASKNFKFSAYWSWFGDPLSVKRLLLTYCKRESSNISLPTSHPREDARVTVRIKHDVIFLSLRLTFLSAGLLAEDYHSRRFLLRGQDASRHESSQIGVRATMRLPVWCKHISSSLQSRMIPISSEAKSCL